MNLGFKFHVKESKTTFGREDIKGKIVGLFARLKENFSLLF